MEKSGRLVPATTAANRKPPCCGMGCNTSVPLQTDFRRPGKPVALASLPMKKPIPSAGSRCHSFVLLWSSPKARGRRYNARSALLGARFRGRVLEFTYGKVLLDLTIPRAGKAPGDPAHQLRFFAQFAVKACQRGPVAGRLGLHAPEAGAPGFRARSAGRGPLAQTGLSGHGPAGAPGRGHHLLGR